MYKPSQWAQLNVYVTDYTKNNRFHLEQYQAEGIESPGMVTEVTFWDEHCLGAQEAFGPGSILKLTNVRVQTSKLGGLQGALHWDKSGHKDSFEHHTKRQGWKVLPRDDILAQQVVE